MKFGLLILLAILLVLWLDHAKRRWLGKRGGAGNAAEQREDTANDAASTGSAGSETILGCSHCGLHVPASDAVFNADGVSFCCDAHRRLHAQP